METKRKTLLPSSYKNRGKKKTHSDLEDFVTIALK